MNSLRTRMTVWFGASFLVVSLVQIGVTYRTLHDELRRKSWRTDYPDHPDWRLHGSYSGEEIRDVLQELTQAAVLGTLPLVVLSGLVGFWLARQSLRPIASVNRQLARKNLANLGEPVVLPEADSEFRELLSQLNGLLRRLEDSFREMDDYAAKVAHELRTPLAILRLKVEQAGESPRPDLAEELQAELHRLTHVVDQSLLIARADRGALPACPEPLDLTVTIRDLTSDFGLLAAETGRRLVLHAPATCRVLVDPRHLRQIAHGLLTNALKHGVGDLQVRIKTLRETASFTVANLTPSRPFADDPSLGLGLRVVTALLRLDPRLKLRTRRGPAYFATRLVCPLAPHLGGRLAQDE